MRRELSSGLTPVYRWVIPALLTVAAIGVIWQVAVADSPGTMAIALALAIAAACVVLARWLDKAKRVWIDEKYLYISDYKREDRIELGRIDRVTSTRWLRPDRVTLIFKVPNIFGDRIVFFPQRKGFRPGAPHPMAKELADLIDKSEQANEN